jgi:diguanylate cyclase (GGDEF)-like protein
VLNPDQTQQLITDESAAKRQLRAGFPWLKFERELEREFRRDQARTRLTQIRFNLYLAVALSLAFGGLNALVLDPEYQRAIYLLQFGLLLPVIVAGIAITYLEKGRHIYPRVAPLLAPLPGIALVAAEIEASGSGVTLLFPTVVIATIFVYYLAGLLFYEALRSNAILWGAYLALGFAGDVPETQLAYNALVLLCANLVGATVAASIERVVRTQFLEEMLLSEIAARDGLTGIYNRRRFDEHLDTHWRQAQRDGVPLALLLVDIDFFKRFNDRHGHQAGDECLKAVAAALARAARRPLDFVARYGGEEFAIVLYDPSREAVAEFGNRIHAGVSSLGIPHGDSPVARGVTVSVGAAYVWPTLERTPHGFVQLADEALYEAKGDGRNRTVFREAEYADLETGSFRARTRGAA